MMLVNLVSMAKHVQIFSHSTYAPRIIEYTGGVLLLLLLGEHQFFCRTVLSGRQRAIAVNRIRVLFHHL